MDRQSWESSAQNSRSFFFNIHFGFFFFFRLKILFLYENKIYLYPFSINNEFRGKYREGKPPDDNNWHMQEDREQNDEARWPLRCSTGTLPSTRKEFVIPTATWRRSETPKTQRETSILNSCGIIHLSKKLGRQSKQSIVGVSAWMTYEAGVNIMVECHVLLADACVSWSTRCFSYVSTSGRSCK